MENTIAMREAFGQALIKLSDLYPDLVVLDADVSSSTRTILFGEKYKNRFFNVGVAEANMMDLAAGMATCGLQPVVSSFAVFLSLKATEQIRNIICYNKLPVIIAGGYAGLSDSFDGASHQSVEDLSLMRSFPGMHVIVPSCPAEVFPVLELALKIKEPVYIRLCRNPVPEYPTNAFFNGIEPNHILHGKDLTMAVCGVPSYMAYEACILLKEKGILADLFIYTSLKPFSVASLIQSVEKSGRMLVIEEHSNVGGLRSAIRDNIPSSLAYHDKHICIQDRFGETGSYTELLHKFGLSKENIVEKALELCL